MDTVCIKQSELQRVWRQVERYICLFKKGLKYIKFSSVSNKSRIIKYWEFKLYDNIISMGKVYIIKLKRTEGYLMYKAFIKIYSKWSEFKYNLYQSSIDKHYWSKRLNNVISKKFFVLLKKNISVLDVLIKRLKGW